LGGAKAGAIADRLLITKGDIATPAQIEALTTRLQALNPVAAIHEAVQGEIDPELLFGTKARLTAPIRSSPPVHEHHDHAVNSCCLTRRAPLDWGRFHDWLGRLRATHGEQLLRVKGVLKHCRGNRADRPCTAFTTRSTRRSL